MTRFARRALIVSAFGVGGFLAIFFGFVNHNGNVVVCHGCQLPRPVLVAKVSIPKGTSGKVIATRALATGEDPARLAKLLLQANADEDISYPINYPHMKLA